jgi:hypothetical protein
VADVDKQNLQKYIEGFKDAIADASRKLRKHEHAEWDIRKYGSYFKDMSNGLNVREGAEKGYDEGAKDAYATIGQDLQDHELEEYSIEDYGRFYENVAGKIGDCLNCMDVGSDKGCPAGKTIWCPRLLENLEE